MRLEHYHAGLDALAVSGQGPRILQSLRFGDSDEAHVSALLAKMQPPPHTHWLDIGCGYGEVARLMQRERPDLRFTLVNSNAAQLRQAPRIFHTVRCDMGAIPLLTYTCDGAMFLYSLCHAVQLDRASREAARVVRPGGHLFVFDHHRLRGDNRETWEKLHAWFHPKGSLLAEAERAGWGTLSWEYPEANDADVISAHERPDWDRMFADLEPFIWRAVRR